MTSAYRGRVSKIPIIIMLIIIVVGCGSFFFKDLLKSAMKLCRPGGVYSVLRRNGAGAAHLEASDQAGPSKSFRPISHFPSCMVPSSLCGTMVDDNGSNPHE